MFGLVRAANRAATGHVPDREYDRGKCEQTEEHRSALGRLDLLVEPFGHLVDLVGIVNAQLLAFPVAWNVSAATHAGSDAPVVAVATTVTISSPSVPRTVRGVTARAAVPVVPVDADIDPSRLTVTSQENAGDRSIGLPIGIPRCRA